MGWRGALSCYLLFIFILRVSPERIVSRTGLILGDKIKAEVNGKEVEYINEYVFSKIGDLAPYLLVQNGTFQLDNLVDAYYQLYKYASDGTTILTYQTRVYLCGYSRDERGYAQLVNKEAIFGVHFHFTFQFPPPPKPATPIKETSDTEPEQTTNDQPTNEQPTTDQSATSDSDNKKNNENNEKNENTGNNESKDNNDNKDKDNNENTKETEKPLEVVEVESEKEESDIVEVKESTTTELSIFQDIKGLLSISSCISYKTPTKNNSQEKEDEENPASTSENANNDDGKKDEGKSDGKLKILSYNIWNYNSPWKSRHQMIAEEVAKIVPDIIAWQEVRYSKWDRMDMKKQTKEERWGGGRFQIEQLGMALLAKELKYHFVYQPAMVYIHNLPDYEIEGLSFFSKYPILESNFVSLSRDLNNHRDEHQRICARALIETPHGRVNVFVTHMSLDEEAQERNAQEILKFADQYEYPQVLMGDFNCLPDSVSIEFLTGARTIDSVTGNFVDAWADYTSHLKSQCDEFGFCERRCTRTTHNASCWEVDGHTFNALDETPRKRIDFVLVRGARVDDVIFVGNEPLMEGDTKIMASDHFGMLANLRIDNKEKDKK